VAPIDRVKILMQTQFISRGGDSSKYFFTRNKRFLRDEFVVCRYTGVFQSLRTIVKEEGIGRLWRGNGVNIVRVIPYTGTQFASYD